MLQIFTCIEDVPSDWKLCRKFPCNDWKEYSNELKTMYGTRDAVHTQEDFDSKIKFRACQNCPPDAPSMTHPEGWCPKCFFSTSTARTKFGPARAALKQAKTSELIKKHVMEVVDRRA